MRLQRPKCTDCGRTVTWKSMRENDLIYHYRQSLSLNGAYSEEDRYLCKQCTDTYRKAYPAQQRVEAAQKGQR